MDIIRAWKNEGFRNNLTAAQRAELPANPAGLIELTEAQLEIVAGGAIKTTPGSGGGCGTGGHCSRGGGSVRAPDRRELLQGRLLPEEGFGQRFTGRGRQSTGFDEKTWLFSVSRR